MTVLTNKISIYRNLSDFKFSNMCTAKEKMEIKDRVINAFSLLNLDFEFFPDLFIENKRVEDFIHDNSLYMSYDDEKLFKYKYASALLSKSRNMAVLINTDEHLMIEKYSSGFEKSYNELKRIVKEISKHLQFSYSDIFGYLTSDIYKTGEAFFLESEIYIPSIIMANVNKDIVSILKNDRYNGIQITNIPYNSKYSAIYNIKKHIINDPQTEIKEFENFLDEVCVREKYFLDVSLNNKSLKKHLHDQVIRLKNNGEIINNVFYDMNLIYLCKAFGIVDGDIDMFKLLKNGLEYNGNGSNESLNYINELVSNLLIRRE